MRLRIRHETAYSYASPAKSIIQVLRLTPRNHEGQHVESWRIDVDLDCRLIPSKDAFGNIVNTFNAAGPVDHVSVVVEGVLETFDTGGVIKGGTECFPPELYLRDTALTRADAALKQFALAATSSATDDLARLHALLSAVNDKLIFDPDPTNSGTSAIDAFTGGRGVCQDFAHIFIACARHLGLPARYVGGYFLRSDNIFEQEAGHAWTEVYVANLGWVGFDPANGISTDEAHVRVAFGLDYLGAAPVRGVQSGGSDEKLKVSVAIRPTQTQRQW